MLLVERGAHLIALELVVLVATNGQRGAIGVERTLEALPTSAQRERVPPRCELDLPFFDHRDAVLRVVVAVTAAEVRLGAGPRQADVAEPAPRLRIHDLAFRCIDVARATAAATEVQRQRSIPDVHITSGAAFARRRPQVEREIAADAHLWLRRNLVGDDVDQTSDRICAVQQRRRPAHDLDLLRGRRIDRNAVVTRLARQIAKALSVLQDQHAIAVEPANDRARRRGTETSRRHTRLTLERGAKRHLELLRQLLTGQHGGRLEGVELAAGVTADRDDFLEMQIEVDLQLDRWCVRSSAHFGASRGEALGEHRQVVRSGRNVFERERSVGARHRLTTEFVDLYCGATKRRAVQRVQ